jgi:hypothetical protein
VQAPGFAEWQPSGHDLFGELQVGQVQQAVFATVRSFAPQPPKDIDAAVVETFLVRRTTSAAGLPTAWRLARKDVPTEFSERDRSP